MPATPEAGMLHVWMHAVMAPSDTEDMPSPTQACRCDSTRPHGVNTPQMRIVSSANLLHALQCNGPHGPIITVRCEPRYQLLSIFNSLSSVQSKVQPWTAHLSTARPDPPPANHSCSRQMKGYPMPSFLGSVPSSALRACIPFTIPTCPTPLINGCLRFLSDCLDVTKPRPVFLAR
ncbi:hypothetical protein BKA81DRAFT_369398 [Phyllosticta paracitricarpa]